MTTPQGHQPATPIKRCASCGAPVTQQPAQHYADARAYLLAKLSTRPAAKSPAGKMLVSRQHLASIYTDLLEALSKFVEFAEQNGEVVFAGGGMPVIDAMNACTTKARAAIAKAAGGQSLTAKCADKIVRRGTPKHGIITQAQRERHLATAGAVISGSTTYEDDNLDTTLLKIYTAFDALKKGDGTEDHFDYLAAAINVSFIRAQDISPALVEQLQHAQDAMTACSRRMQQHGKSGFTGPEMQHVALAIEAHEEILRHSTPIQMWRALRKVQDNYRAAKAAQQGGKQ